MKRLLILIFVLLILSACAGDDNSVQGPTPTPSKILTCLVGVAYCEVLQIVDLETGCVTVAGYKSGFVGPSSVGVSCPWDKVPE